MRMRTLPEDAAVGKFVFFCWVLLILGATSAFAAEASTSSGERSATTTLLESDPSGIKLPIIGGPKDWTKPEQLTSSLQVMLLLTVVSLAPAILLMTTSFVRIVVVLGLLRQALGTQQLPPSQVITSLALFISLLIMAPVWKQSYEEGIKPYTAGEIDLEMAFDRSLAPVREFMAKQITNTQNQDDVIMFLVRVPDAVDPETGELAEDYALANPEPGRKLVPLVALLARLLAQRTENRVPDWLPNLLAVCDSRHRGRQRHHLDGDAHAATRADLAALQTALVRPRRRLAVSGANAVRKLCVVKEILTAKHAKRREKKKSNANEAN